MSQAKDLLSKMESVEVPFSTMITQKRWKPKPIADKAKFLKKYGFSKSNGYSDEFVKILTDNLPDGSFISIESTDSVSESDSDTSYEKGNYPPETLKAYLESMKEDSIYSDDAVKICLDKKYGITAVIRGSGKYMDGFLAFTDKTLFQKGKMY